MELVSELVAESVTKSLPELVLDESLTPGGRLRLYRDPVDSELANHWFECLRDNCPWEQSTIAIYGREVLIPRRNAWYGDPGCEYGYSGTRLTRNDWLPELAQMREEFTRLADAELNSVLLNHYRDGSDSMGWHQDDEAELGRNPIIVSYNLGATRRFQLRPRGQTRISHSLDLDHNSLLIMGGDMQHHWQHAVPKTRRPVGERINLTFRNIVLHEQR